MHSSMSPLSRYSSWRSPAGRPLRCSCLSSAARVAGEGAKTAGVPSMSSSMTTPALHMSYVCSWEGTSKGSRYLAQQQQQQQQGKTAREGMDCMPQRAVFM